jgi:hypothetical protein
MGNQPPSGCARSLGEWTYGRGNLVTLYGTCHKGLDPDFEPSLRELARLPGSTIILDSDSSEFRADVVRYREFIARSTSDETVWA